MKIDIIGIAKQFYSSIRNLAMASNLKLNKQKDKQVSQKKIRRTPRQMSDADFEKLFTERFEIYLGKAWLKSKWPFYSITFLTRGRCLVYLLPQSLKGENGVFWGKMCGRYIDNLILYSSEAQEIWRMSCSKSRLEFDDNWPMVTDDRFDYYIDIEKGTYVDWKYVDGKYKPPKVRPNHLNPYQNEVFDQKVIEIDGHKLEFKHHVAQITPIGNGDYLVVYQLLHDVNPGLSHNLERVNSKGEVIWRIKGERAQKNWTFERVSHVFKCDGEWYVDLFDFQDAKLDIETGRFDLESSTPKLECPIDPYLD